MDKPKPKQLSKCPQCDGCGKIDSRDQKPWNRFQKMRDPGVFAGNIQPVLCKDCEGSGFLPKPSEHPKIEAQFNKDMAQWLAEQREQSKKPEPANAE